LLERLKLENQPRPEYVFHLLDEDDFVLEVFSDHVKSLILKIKSEFHISEEDSSTDAYVLANYLAKSKKFTK